MTRKKVSQQIVWVYMVMFLLSGCVISVVEYTPIIYSTSCGQGAYTFEPYPAVYDHTLSSTPPTMSTNQNASCLSPGSTFTAWPLQEKYADLISITKVELVIYHLGVLDHADKGKYWHPKQDPEYYELNSGYHDGTLSASIPDNITGVAPTAADIRMTYVNNNGYTREVLFEDGREDLSEHMLFFVPKYDVILATRRVDIGFDAFDHTVTGYTFLGFNLAYPRGWERYCTIENASIFDPSFPGTAKFFDSPLSPNNPNHRYYVWMPSGRTGHFEFNYRIICPKGQTPSGSHVFTSWDVLGSYEGTLRGGLPPYSQVTYPPNSWYPPESPYN